MVHSDVNVSRAEKSLEPGAKDLEFLAALGQMRGECALLFPEPRHVRVAEHGHAVRGQRQHLFDRRLKGRGGLVRQSVDQVHAEAFKSQLARGDDQVARHLIWLDAANRLLHLWAENPECPC